MNRETPSSLPPSPPIAPRSMQPTTLVSTDRFVLGAGHVTALHAATWVAMLLAGGQWTLAADASNEATNVSWNS
jgi:hypothetical protein